MGTVEPQVAADAQSPQSTSDRRLPPGDRGPEAEWHRHDLRAARDPDHRPDAPGAGRGPAHALVPARAERRLRRLDRRLPHAKAGHLPHRVGAGLPERPHRARARHDQLLPDDPHQRLLRARDRGPAAGRLRGDGPARHRQAGVQGGLSACCTPRTSASASRARIRAAVSGRPGGVYLDLPAKLFAQSMDAAAGRLADQGRRSRADADSGARGGQARARSARTAQEAAHRARQGRGLRAVRRRHPSSGREDRHSVPADVDGQGPAARHARAVRLGRALVRAARGRRRDADRRAPELAALARQGQDLGRQGPQGLGRPEVHPGRHLAAGSRQQRADRCAGGGRHRLVRVRDACWKTWTAGRSRRRSGRRHQRAQGEEHRQDGRDAARRIPRR